MKQKQKEKLMGLLKKNTQKDALFLFLEAGNQFSISEAQRCGIADPRRVINQLRENGHRIFSFNTKESNKMVKRYAIAV